MVFKNIEEVKQANEALGRYWFSPNTITFFGSKVETPVFDGRYWIESTRNYDDSGREYRVVKAEDDGDISYLTQDRFGTLARARSWLAEYLGNQLMLDSS